MTLDELNQIKTSLKDALAADTGTGHWLPQKYRDDLSKSINLINREIRKLKNDESIPAILRFKPRERTRRDEQEAND